jgi:Tol biopolymer transport system component
LDRWRQIESLFQEALLHDPAERHAFVREVCQGDIELQREVSSLLANHDEAASEPWAAAAAAQLIDACGSLRPGESLGPYRIESFLAAGGMGRVYRAIDTRLNRQVAIKVCAGRFGQQFEREARVIASLNHPNICTLYDVGPNYLVMEYIEGPTLAERIHQGPIPLPEVLEIARQMAAALEEAHQRPIFHRDFKPGNVKIKPDGTVKVLDFGLAKLAAGGPMGPAAGANASDIPTLTMAATQPGVLLGTAAYMSPEQARGKPVDKRGDVWAFGTVFWEMLTGERLFQGKTTSDVLAAVIRDEPDLNQVPAKVRPLLKRCLEKDPQRRLRDIGDAMGIVENAPDGEGARRSWLAWGVAGLFLAALALVSFLHFHQTPPERRLMTTSINAPENIRFDFAASFPLTMPALSPDGRRIVFRARGTDGKIQLWVRPLDSTAAQPLAGTDNAEFPFWSPDSGSVGFFAEGKLKRIDLAGGPALTLADAPAARGGSWSPRNVIVFAGNPSGQLQRVAVASGTPPSVTTIFDRGPDFTSWYPWFFPDGRHFLFADQARAASDEMTLRIGELDSQELKTVGQANSNAVYSGGYLLYMRQNTLMAQPFDEKRLAVTGEARPIAEQVLNVQIGTTSVSGFSASQEGLLVYQAGAAGSQQLTWFDRRGKPVGTLGDAGDFWALEFSPDRKNVAVSRLGPNNDIWIFDTARGLPTRFTFSPAEERNPVWSPDGRSIVYSSDARSQFDLYRKLADGTGNEELLYADGTLKVPASWSPDGKLLMYSRLGSKEIWVLPVTTPSAPGVPAKPFQWLLPPLHGFHPKFSPDGRWVAYVSDDSGQNEIYVAPFPGPGSRRQISTGGGSFPRWRSDSKEIFYVASGTLMAAEVSIKSGSIEAGAVRSLGIPVMSPHYRYEVSADGQQFLIATPVGQKSPPPLTLVQNWTALLKSK